MSNSMNHRFEEPSLDRLELAIEEYLNQRGMLDIDEWLSRYPDFTSELLEFLNNQAEFGAMMAAFSGPTNTPTCQIGGYELLEIVDRGGMGVVYKARQTKLQRIVAIKMIQQGKFCSAEVRRRFQNEAETVSRLKHPNLVAIHEVGDHNGVPWFSMEFIDGRTLSDLARQGRIQPRVVARIAQSIAETMHYTHGCGVLHRDLKPSNVMIDKDCEVRVTDFGLAKQLDRHYSMTESGQILGSIDYMPPEQAEARHKHVGPASDVYSIGAIIYELLAGRPPFRSETFLETLRQIREQKPIPPSQIHPRVPAELERICLKCLEKKPGKRFVSAKELSLALERFLQDDPVPQISRRQQLGNWIASNPAIFSITLAITSLLLLLNCLRAAGFIGPASRSSASVVAGNDAGLKAIPVGLSVDHPASVNNVGSLIDSDQNALATANDAGDKVPIARPQNARPSDPAAAVALVRDDSSPPAANSNPLPVQPGDAPGDDNAGNGRPLADPSPVSNEPAPYNVISAVTAVGEPFGVAFLEVEFDPGADWKYVEDVPLKIVAKDGKAMYGAFRYVNARRETTRMPAEPARLQTWFLFSGAPPSQVSLISADQPVFRDVALKNQGPEKTHRELRDAWWSRFLNFHMEHASPELNSVSQYFVTMLANRFELSAPRDRRVSESSSSLEKEFERTAGMLFGFESVRLAMMASPTPTQSQSSELAGEELPQPLQIRSVAVPTVRQSVTIEPIAMRVPEECFYMRCFRVQNYAWVRSLVQGWGGDLDGIVATPAVDNRLRERIETQLALNLTELMKSGVDDHLADCALIGLDPFFNDGAALGVLLEASQNDQLAQILANERHRAAMAGGLKEQKLQISGSTVSLLSTRHHEVRSFHAKSGRFHLITNSQALAQRFLETERGARSLGQLAEYRYARSEVDANPDGQCVAWLYLPDPFFRNITSPRYRIELERRRQAARDLVTLGLARMAAEAESELMLSVDDLIRHKYLTEEFGRRPDHSQSQIEDQMICDSLRGCHGTFLPIADVSVDRCTRSESRAYREFQDRYQKEWRTMDPVLLTFCRNALQKSGRESVVLRIRVTPYAQNEYQFLRDHLYRKPSARRIAMQSDELLGVSSRLNGGEDLWVHAGLNDADIAYELRDGDIHRLGENVGKSFAQTHSYAIVTDQRREMVYRLIDFVASIKSRKATQIQPGSERASGNFLATVIGFILPFEQIIANMVESALDKYGQTGNDATVLAHDRKLGSEILQRHPAEDTPRPAQLFMQLRDVKNSRVYDYLRAWTFISSRRMSASDAAIINRTSDMLQREPKELRDDLERILNAAIVCPTGGTYQFQDATLRSGYLVSSGWGATSVKTETAVPENYEFPFFAWLRGLSLECTLDTNSLHSRLELEVQCKDIGKFMEIP